LFSAYEAFDFSLNIVAVASGLVTAATTLHGRLCGD
jgi:hypothetical protein